MNFLVNFMEVKMKPFNLEAALLQGEPFYASGQKCYIAREVTEFLDDKSIRKFVVIFPDDHTRVEIWYEDDFVDDIEMWEEPTPTVTVTLPKPFKPNDSEPFWFINVRMSGQLKAEYVSSEAVTSFRHWCITQGNCFRTEEDTQAWIDAMREVVYE